MEGETVEVAGLKFTPYLSQSQIASRVGRVAAEIRAHYAGQELPILLCMLNGAFVFAADLLRALQMEVEIEFIRYSSYQGTSSCGEVSEILGLRQPLRGKRVLVVEDIVDSGLTMARLIQELERQGAKEVRIAAMFTKPEAFRGSYTVHHVGEELPNRFVVVYGLDYNGLGRGLPELYIRTE